jgi:hypothetical protein
MVHTFGGDQLESVSVSVSVVPAGQGPLGAKL